MGPWALFGSVRKLGRRTFNFRSISLCVNSNKKMAASETPENIFEFAEAYTIAKSSSECSKTWEGIIRMFDVNISRGKMIVPETFQPKVQRWFSHSDDDSPKDAITRAENQVIVRIVNKWTFEQTLFNPIRSRRPLNINNKENRSKEDEKDALSAVSSSCDFCMREEYTAIDSWGRIERKTAITASNCAKYDAFHSMIIFKDHHPLKYSKELLTDIFSICEEWFLRAHETNEKAIYPMFSWNCQGRAGASQIHGHAHVLLGENFPYGRYQYLQHVAKNYNLANPNRNYFMDLISTSRTLGLAKSVGESTILINLTPGFPYDLIVLSWNFNQDFQDAMNEAIKLLTQQFGSVSFNVTISFPPLEDGKVRKTIDANCLKEALCKEFAPMPYIGCLIDRGDPSSMASDMCGQRILLGNNLVPTDPFYAGKVLTEVIQNGQ
ncbi:uncharacterized protein [Clytia hemisphaerica]|uniref:Uncharacterized protein n=1 Tax=Clytia hemisphaerica TaxID=252671 RepID=A0A7M5VEG8_9CNID